MVREVPIWDLVILIAYSNFLKQGETDVFKNTAHRAIKLEPFKRDFGVRDGDWWVWSLQELGHKSNSAQVPYNLGLAHKGTSK